MARIGPRARNRVSCRSDREGGETKCCDLETETGWWLVTHPDHARLAGAFAEHWGNDRFLPPEPRANVLKGIARHDDGWAERDAAPQITRQGKPSAFSVELVGKYSAFEEIDLEDYLAVRDRAVRLIAEEDAYAAILISMHTYNLLTDHADRSTIAPEQLPLLDEFLEKQKGVSADAARCKSLRTQSSLRSRRPKRRFSIISGCCRRCDNLSLLTCVDFSAPSHLLHPCRCAAEARRGASALGGIAPLRARSLPV